MRTPRFCTCGGPDGAADCPRHGELSPELAELEELLAEADADQRWLTSRAAS